MRAATLAGPFTVLLHPTNDAIEDNEALPHTQEIGAPDSWHEPLRAAFVSHGRVPAIHWIDEYSPQLAAMLQAIGFVEHRREALLVCSQESLGEPAPMHDLTFVAITDTSPLAEARANLDANAAGFDPVATQPTTDEQAARFRATLTRARAFTARLHGLPVGAGMYTAPAAGVTELAGITTLEPYRGRGIAKALTAHMASAAFADGCDLVFLCTANSVARRAYERAGFQPAGDVLTFYAR
jgi:predicted GNAT family acetyltransferase